MTIIKKYIAQAFILIFLFIKCQSNIDVGYTDKNNPRFQMHKLKLEDMNKILLENKEKIEHQLSAIEIATEIINDASLKLQDMEEFLKSNKKLQDSQNKNYSILLNEAELLEEMLKSELTEKDSRVAQLEYRIRRIHKKDPYIETFKMPIEKFWIAVDLNETSNWGFITSEEKNKAIYQHADIKSIDLKPASILILKSHELLSGFVSCKIFLADTYLISGKGSAGIVFLFINSHNYWMVELSKEYGQGKVILSKIENGQSHIIAETPLIINHDEKKHVICQFTLKNISVFVDNNLSIEVDLSSSMSYINGSVGLFTKNGKAEFYDYTTGPLMYLSSSGLDNKQSRHNLNQNFQNIKSDQNELRRLEKKTFTINFRQLNLYDSQSVVRIPGATGDYEEAPSRVPEKVIPVSGIHVPEMPNPEESIIQENITEESNNIFKPQETHPNSENEKITKKDYANGKIDMNDWVPNSNNNWMLINEFGIPRLSVQMGVIRENGPSVFQLKNIEQNHGKYSVRLRLDFGSEAGIIFRSLNKENHYLATISTIDKTINLKCIKDNKIDQLQSVYKSDLNAQLRHNLEIIDFGENNNGLIQVFVDGNLIITHVGIFEKSGSVGIIIEQGIGVFDSFSIKK